MKSLCAFVVAMSLALASAVTISAQASQSTSAPTLVRIDGELKTATGQPRTGSVSLVASLYADKEDSTPLWVEQQVVTLDQAGRYTLLVGATQPDGVRPDFFLSSSGHWIGIAVQGEAEQPRVMLVSVPYALKAREADTLAGKTASDFVLTESLSDTVKSAMKTSRAGLAGSNSTTPGVFALTTNFLVKSPSTDSIIFDDGTNNVSMAGSFLIKPVASVAQRLRLWNAASTNEAFIRDAGAGSASELAFEPAGVERLRIKSSGTIDASADVLLKPSGGVVSKLRFWNATGSNEAIIRDVGASGASDLVFEPAGAEVMRVNSAGRVGIGTNAPIEKLEVDGNILLKPSGGVTSRIRLWNAASSNETFIRDVGVSGASDLVFEPAGVEVMRVNSAGRVGIGTNAPIDKLEVDGNILLKPSGGVTSRIRLWNATSNNETFIRDVGASGASALVFEPAGVEVMRINTVGVTVAGNIGAKYQDVAEWVETVAPLEPGTIVIVDPLQPNRVMPSSRAYDTRVAGAVSRQPGLILGEPGDTKAMVAQSGRVRIKADAKYGAIRIGDLLVTSPTPGYAMRSRPLKVAGQTLHRPGTLVGKALEALPNGKGEILVLLTLQ
jgi:hypothetical protein